MKAQSRLELTPPGWHAAVVGYGMADGSGKPAGGTAKPVIFISYSHLDEPEKPGDGEVKWLTFVRKFLGPLEKHGVLQVWDDRKIRGGAGWRKEIEKQLNACDICILLVSPNSLSSDFILDDEVKRILERRKEEGVEFFPIHITPTPFKGADWLTEMQLRPGKTESLFFYPLNEREAKMVAIVEEIAAIPDDMEKTGRRAAKLAPDKAGVPDVIDITRLPETPYKRLVGRDEQLAALDNAWSGTNTNIVSLIAWGGAGKTALVNEWLNRMRDDSYRGATAVLGWSFYDQGTKERTTSTDEFFNWALEKLDIKVDSPSVTVKGEKLAEELAGRRVLLILDGVEPLQHGPGGQEGELKDYGLRVFLRRFATMPPSTAHSLVVLSSRLEIRDIEQWRDSANKRSSALVIDLGRLSDDAAIALLADNGVKGSENELRATAREFEGHALALSLLASLLVRRHQGDVRRRDCVGPLLQKTTARGHDHARRVMQADGTEWLAGEPVLTAILFAVGLFDRPASGNCLTALRSKPVIEGLNESLVGLDSDAWLDAVSALREVRLLDPVDPANADALDAHPLVREWFGERLKEKSEKAWREAHGRLYEHLRATTHEGKMPALKDLAPLYQAIAHGCRSGRYQEALDEVFKNRIFRRFKNSNEFEYYSTFKLGAFQSDLASIAWFFEHPYRTPVTSLRESDQSWVLGIAAFRLLMLGRFSEAMVAQRARLDLEVAISEWKSAAGSAANITEGELAVGHVHAAISSAESAVVYANQSANLVTMSDMRSNLAFALQAGGKLRDAESLFAETERQINKYSPDQPFIEGIYGYRHCDLLMATGKWPAARTRAKKTLAQSIMSKYLPGIAFSSLTLARVFVHSALNHMRESNISTAHNDTREARTWFAKAVDRLRATGDLAHIPDGFLDRAAFHRVVGNWDGATRDLDEIEEIAGPGPMKLFLCDMAIGRARLAFAQIEAFAPLNGIEKSSPPKPAVPDAAEIVRLKDEAARQLAIAADYIEKCGYHRRDEELAELQAVLRGERKVADLPPRV